MWTLAEPYVDDAGFELCEVQAGREASGFVVRIFIDRLAGVGSATEGAGTVAGTVVNTASISHEDCERVSRDLSAALDVADLIPHAYQLEVSSPGLDRPLRRERDFARFAGQSARIRLTEGVDGRRNFSGTLRGAHDGLVEIDCDGRSYQLPIAGVAQANLIPDWDAEFHRSAS